MGPLPLVTLLIITASGPAQQTPVRPSTRAQDATPSTLAAIGPNLWRLAGKESYSQTTYVRIFLFADGPGKSSSFSNIGDHSAAPDFNQATLTGQCTRDAHGKLAFEFFVNFGNVVDSAFYPPWHSTGEDDLFPPRTPKTQLTLDFLGYAKVRPIKRQFEGVEAPGPAQLRYLSPGAGSTNMEPPGWLFRYLRALPTFRLSGNGHVADFATTGWLAELHKEPICAASGA